MIHTAYFHGDDQPATGLTVRQIKAARRDPASALWIDLDRASAAEEERLLSALGSQPAWAVLTELAASPPFEARGAAQPGGPGALRAYPLDVWIDGPMFVTRHAHDSDVVRRLAERLQPHGGALAGGPALLLAALGEALADGYASAMQPSDAAMSGRVLAQRAGEIERAAAQATAAFGELGARLARAGGAGADALASATGRLASLAETAAEEADVAAGAAATAGLEEAIAAATRQLRLTQLIMLGALGLLAAITVLLWQIAGALP